jgi:hypothetical protein
MTRLLALGSYGTLKPRNSPGVSGFFDTAPEVIRRLGTWQGFVNAALAVGDRTTYACANTDPMIWGERQYPNFHDRKLEEGSVPVLTLSVWRSVEDVRSFSYSDIHGRALERRRDWFHKLEGHTYAMWWFDRSSEWPTFQEASRQILTLRSNGPSTQSFDFSYASITPRSMA